MGKLLGIDLGLKRTGIAITDELQIVASPLETVATGDILPYLSAILAKEGIATVIVGEPRHMDGADSQMTENVRRFCAALQKQHPKLEIILEDERFTSKMASEALIFAGVKKKKRREKGTLDKVSAALILQSYLEKKK